MTQYSICEIHPNCLIHFFHKGSPSGRLYGKISTKSSVPCYTSKGYNRLWEYRSRITYYNPFNPIAYLHGSMLEIVSSRTITFTYIVSHETRIWRTPSPVTSHQSPVTSHQDIIFQRRKYHDITNWRKSTKLHSSCR